MEFEEHWNKIKYELSSTTLIKNWSRDQEDKDGKGYLGEDFTAKYNSAIDRIECNIGVGKSIQRIPKKSFKMLYDNWDTYKQKRVLRNQLREKTRFSKYTISIFHHLGL